MMKKYIKGKHEYIIWGKKAKQVKTLLKKKRGINSPLHEPSQERGISIISESYPDEFTIIANQDEFIIDFLKHLAPNHLKILKRFIISPKKVKELLLNSGFSFPTSV